MELRTMKTLTVLIFTLFVFSTALFSQLDYPITMRIETGKTPSQIYLTEAGPIVYCSGYDANFNGEFDDGDEPPSLWFLHIAYTTLHGQYDVVGSEKLIDLEFKMPLLPIRNHWDHFNRVLFVINKNSIDTVSFDYTGDMITKKGKYLDNIENVSAVSTFEKRLYISVRPDNSSGLVYVYDMEKEVFTDTITAGPGVQLTEYVPEQDMLIILNEGNFGAADGSIQMVTFEDGKPGTPYLFPMGGTPNHFLVNREKERIIVTCNASNNIIFMNYQQGRDTLKLDLPEYDGPRETNLCLLDMGGEDPMYFAVPAYDGNVYILDKEGEIYDTLDAKGKAESVVSIVTDIIIATPFIKGTYTPDTAVTVYTKILSADDIDDKSDWYVYPNPFRNAFSIETDEEVNVISAEIINILGETVDNIEAANVLTGTISTDILPGQYFIRIRHSKGVTTLPFIVE